ncbi:MAG TPA: hypothetical protein VFA52_01505 [Candidatus Paceibacterota bacterium]|nr:hypothetical protein [Candidatus Paceibacterota bacterium]
MKKYELLCVCGNRLFAYFKKDKKAPKCCYLNQILPSDLIKFQSDLNNTDPDNVRLLICIECHHMIGMPIKRNGELAFLLRQSRFKEKEMQRIPLPNKTSG